MVNPSTQPCVCSAFRLQKSVSSYKTYDCSVSYSNAGMSYFIHNYSLPSGLYSVSLQMYNSRDSTFVAALQIPTLCIDEQPETPSVISPKVLIYVLKTLISNRITL